MALPLVKVGILVGAGILGSYLAKEGRVSDVVSGAFKIAWKQMRDDKSKTPSVKKPSNDALMAQMNKIRQELQSYSSSGPITIVTGSRTGASRYGIIIVVVVAGYGYFWWKGWKLPDMMFATRRSLADAGKSFSKQIDGVFSSISVTRRQLSSNLDGVDCNLAESIETTVRTQQEVIELQGKTYSISTDFRKVQHAVLTMVIKDVSLLSRWKTIDLYIQEVDSMKFELSMNRCSDSLSKLEQEITRFLPVTLCDPQGKPPGVIQ